jgi:hypothetical protein
MYGLLKLYLLEMTSACECKKFKLNQVASQEFTRNLQKSFVHHHVKEVTNSQVLSDIP